MYALLKIIIIVKGTLKFVQPVIEKTEKNIDKNHMNSHQKQEITIAILVFLQTSIHLLRFLSDCCVFMHSKDS